MYSNGLSEVVLGKSLKKLNVPRADLVILTKVCQPVKAGSVGGKRPPGTAEALDNAGYVNQRGLSRKHIFDSVQDSLKRLDTDYIDVLQCHSEQFLSNVRDMAAEPLCTCKDSTRIPPSRK
jgi:aryl-alcohol dehydrogenase-like predicted oxidoreductase